MLFLLFGCWQSWSVQTNDDCAEPPTWYVDEDGDGVGSDGYTLVRCTQPDGYAAEGGDCDDSSAERYPGAQEVCDGADDDCDALVDEEGATVYYPDADGDGFGDDADATSACEPPDGFVTDGGDCDDQDSDRHPEQDELCDDVDQDCDDAVDEEPVDGDIWYADVDQDGFGDAELRACTQPEGSADTDGDCDDSNGDVNPGADEICNNGVDDNCDESVTPCAWEGDYDAFNEAESWLYGDTPLSYHGWSIASGDLDNDGQQDLLVGVLNYESGPGHIARVETFPAALDLETEADFFVGESDDWAGWSMAIVDNNGDGYDDLLVGALNAEVVYLVHGPVSAGDLSDGEVFDQAGIGYSVAGGDLESDGADELLMGAPTRGDGGQVWVANTVNEDADRVEGANAGDNLGTVVLGVDVDGDGQDDLVASGTTGSTVVVFTTRPQGAVNASDADVSIAGDVSYGFGTALEVGDLDNDGSPDLFVGSPRESYNGSSSGAAFAFLSPSGSLTSDDADRRFDGPTPSDEAGTAIAVGHVDDDGQHDLIISSPGYSGDSGVGHLLLSPGTGGAYDLSDADATFEGSLEDGYYGYSVLLVDLDQDGDDDPVFSAPGEYDDAGGVWVWLTPGL